MSFPGLLSIREWTGDGVLRVFTQGKKPGQVTERASGVVHTKLVTFTEDGKTTYTATVPIPAGSIVHEIEFRSPALWDDGSGADLIIGDDDDPNGYFVTIDLLATDLLVGEVLKMSNSENWGGKQGVYLVAATGLNSANYYATANNIIAVIVTTDQDGTAGRSLLWVTYSTAPAKAAVGV